MARSRELSGITTSFATRALNYKHPHCYARRVADPSARSAAVRLAEDLRERRDTLVRRIADAELRLSDLVGDESAGPVKVVVLAQAVPGAGKVGSRRVLEELGVAPGTRWGELGAPLAVRVAVALELAVRADGASRASGT